MKIRKMEISDYDSVYSLWMSCQGMGLNNIDDAEEGIERFLKRNPDTCFVAEENGGLQVSSWREMTEEGDISITQQSAHRHAGRESEASWSVRRLTH